MTTFVTIIPLIVWPVFELVILGKERLRGRAACAEGGSAVIVWLVAAPAALLAVSCRLLDLAPFPFDVSWSLPVASSVVVAGLAVRVVAFATLGRLFSVDIVFEPGHRLVTSGLYARVRHPAYAGLLSCFLGLGIVSWSWLGVVVATVPLFVVLRHRIHVEEAVMLRLFGAEYERYRAATKRLVPGVY
jgi:protein-S-isoprenylcysteine O-methyltransferase Ste14